MDTIKCSPELHDKTYQIYYKHYIENVIPDQVPAWNCQLKSGTKLLKSVLNTF